MRKLLLPLSVLFLVGCSAAPPQGHFVASCDYVQTAKGLNLVCEQVVTATPSGATPTSSPIPPTPSPIPTQSPTVTAVPTVTPTVVPSPTEVVTPVVGKNLFTNPEFEGGATPYTWPSGLKLPEVATVSGWKPFFCDFPYKAGPCPALFQGTKNPSNLMMGRPEMRNTTVSNRVHGGSGAQYWFCQFRTCDGGVYQTVATSPGSTCLVSAYVQSWSRIEWDNSLTPDQNFNQSTFPNGDAYSNSLWRIAVDPYGGVNIDSSNVVSSSWYSLPHTITSINNQVIQALDHYDKFALITYTFTAKGSFVTVYFENLRLFPFTFNDSAIDDASIVCNGENGSSTTITPALTNTPISAPIDKLPANVEYTIVVPVLSVRSSIDLTSNNITRTMQQGTKIVVHCVIESPSEVFWGSPSYCQTASEWFIIRLNGIDYAKPPIEPEG